MSQPVNGHGAVDLGALKAQAAQREALEAQREQITAQLLSQAGLLRRAARAARTVEE